MGPGVRRDDILVIAGLDPAIHPFRRLLRRWMDTRVKPAHDAVRAARIISAVTVGVLRNPRHPPTAA
jgi:hypothetical protein